MVEAALRFDGVSAGYGLGHVLEEVSFAVQPGERMAIVGRNGAGKTTTLATAMGLTRLLGGEIRLNGARIDGLPTHRRAWLGLGLVPQTRDIFPSLTVEENLIAGMKRDGDLQQAYALFPRLRERRRNGGGQLSGGEQQMLAVARTLMGRPSVLLLDEPLEGLAPVICEQLMDVFRRLAQGGDHTIVLVEQHANLALEFAERIVVLDNGRVAFAGTSAALRADPTILERHLAVGTRQVA